MDKIEEVLKKWGMEALNEQESGCIVMSNDIIQRISDIREALKGCSVMRWRPGDVVPGKAGTYLCNTRRFTGQRGKIIFGGYNQIYYSVRDGQWAGLPVEYIIRWTELPERSA